MVCCVTRTWLHLHIRLWAMLGHALPCCAALCCAVLCCAVLCCAVLCCAVFCCAVLRCAVLCCAVLCCAVLRHAMLCVPCCTLLCCAVLCCACCARLSLCMLCYACCAVPSCPCCAVLCLCKHEFLNTMQGINNFCREIGITRTGGELPLHILDFHVRAHLHFTSPRTLAVLHPLRLVITNLPEDHLEMVDAKASSRGTQSHSPLPRPPAPFCPSPNTSLAMSCCLLHFLPATPSASSRVRYATSSGPTVRLLRKKKGEMTLVSSVL